MNSIRNVFVKAAPNSLYQQIQVAAWLVKHGELLRNRQYVALGLATYKATTLSETTPLVTPVALKFLGKGRVEWLRTTTPCPREGLTTINLLDPIKGISHVAMQLSAPICAANVLEPEPLISQKTELRSTLNLRLPHEARARLEIPSPIGHPYFGGWHVELNSQVRTGDVYAFVWSLVMGQYILQTLRAPCNGRIVSQNMQYGAELEGGDEVGEITIDM